MNLASAHLRIARPTDAIVPLLRFYCEGLGMSRLGGFAGHAGFDGEMVGYPGGGYHLEFTHQRGHTVGRAPTQDNLLVFYLEDAGVWQTAVDRMIACGYAPVVSYNPYWDKVGRTFEDPDGYRVVLQNAAWE